MITARRLRERQEAALAAAGTVAPPPVEQTEAEIQRARYRAKQEAAKAAAAKAAEEAAGPKPGQPAPTTPASDPVTEVTPAAPAVDQRRRR